MSKEDLTTTHELHIRMEMTDDGKVHFSVTPDNAIYRTLNITPYEMATNNAPISAIATRILFHMCCDETVKKAIDVAFEIKRRVKESATADPDRELLDLPTGLVIH